MLFSLLPVSNIDAGLPATKEVQIKGQILQFISTDKLVPPTTPAAATAPVAQGSLNGIVFSASIICSLMVATTLY